MLRTDGLASQPADPIRGCGSDHLCWLDHHPAPPQAGAMGETRPTIRFPTEPLIDALPKR